MHENANLATGWEPCDIMAPGGWVATGLVRLTEQEFVCGTIRFESPDARLAVLKPGKFSITIPATNRIIEPTFWEECEASIHAQSDGSMLTGKHYHFGCWLRLCLLRL